MAPHDDLSKADLSKADLSREMEEIRWYAMGTQSNATTLIHAQRIGVPPGKLDPWTIDYMRLSVDIWLLTCPESYVKGLGHSMAFFGATMANHQLDDGPDDDWALLITQASSIVAAVSERFTEFAGEPAKRLERSDAPQGILRYDRLAALATKPGSTRLEYAASNVITYCLRRLHGSVSTEEIEWLRAFQEGERTVDVAVHYGYSERDFYRVLSRLWEKLGVSGRAEAIAQASRMGWFD